jgi:hypothetical protein
MALVVVVVVVVMVMMINCYHTHENVFSMDKGHQDSVKTC